MESNQMNGSKEQTKRSYLYINTTVELTSYCSALAEKQIHPVVAADWGFYRILDKLWGKSRHRQELLAATTHQETAKIAIKYCMSGLKSEPALTDIVCYVSYFVAQLAGVNRPLMINWRV